MSVVAEGSRDIGILHPLFRVTFTTNPNDVIPVFAVVALMMVGIDTSWLMTLGTNRRWNHPPCPHFRLYRGTRPNLFRITRSRTAGLLSVAFTTTRGLVPRFLDR